MQKKHKQLSNYIQSGKISDRFEEPDFIHILKMKILRKNSDVTRSLSTKPAEHKLKPNPFLPNFPITAIRTDQQISHISK